MMGQGKRFIPVLNFLSSCLAIPEVLFPAEGNLSPCVISGYLKRMKDSSVGPSSPLLLGGVHLAYCPPRPFADPFF